MVTAAEKAVSERDTATTTMNVIKAKIATHATTPLNYSQIQYFINETQTLRNGITEIHNRIMSYGPTNPDDHELIYKNAMSTLVDMQCDLRGFVAKSDPAGSTSSTTAPRSSQSFRLPKIEIPTFDGDLTNWLGFRDLFQTAVHNNTEWSDAQKLTYLKSKLTGGAINLLKSTTITDANYQPAWKSVQERYENKRELVFSILNRFVGQPAMDPDSAASLRSIVDVSRECLRSLETLITAADHRDALLVFLMSKKVDKATRQLWEQSMTDNSVPKLDDFTAFLEQRARALSSEGTCDPAADNAKSHPRVQEKSSMSKKTHVHHASKITCPFCSESHSAYTCKTLRAMDVPGRNEMVKRKSLCFNCLQPNHSSSKCKSKYRCKECNGNHNTLLHRTPTPPAAAANPAQQANSSIVSFHSQKSSQAEQGLLATVMVKLNNRHGVPNLCRAFLDGGASASFITESCVKRLGLTKTRTSAEVDGLASMSVGTIKAFCTLDLKPYFHTPGDESHNVTCLILPSLTADLPFQKYKPEGMTHLTGLQLADPSWYEPGKIDILLGADIFWDLLLAGKKSGPPGTPLTVQTKLGWVVVGKTDGSSSRVTVNHVGVTLDQQLQQFWELESVPTTRILTKEEEKCEQHFVDTVSRTKDGQYIVSLPFDENKPALGESRDTAISRLRSLERRLSTKPNLKKEYVNFMRDYESLGHMEEVVPTTILQNPTSGLSNSEATKGYYIPHHFVLKESSTTTKFRVVFDASAKTSSGTSLNERLMVGPTIQDSLMDILMRFRTHTVAFTADIAKMYRQISIRPEDRHWQKIVWRENLHDEIKEYKLLTVTYGTASAPYHATRVLRQLTIDEGNDFPLALNVMCDDFYVDDLMSGSSTVPKAIATIKELVKLSARGHFELRKWSSNVSEVLEAIPEAMRETQVPLSMDKEDSIKTLGLHWCPGLDIFTFKVNLPTLQPGVTITKRMVLSEVAKIFDPLGWLAPVVTTAKILLQEMWKAGVGWDDPLPTHILKSWAEFCSQLPCIERLKLPRNICTDNASSITLHGFCDSSELAYSAAVYTRAVQQNGNVVVSLIAAKTRVAPVKTVPLPRLELCGAVLLSKLMPTVKNALKVSIENSYSWSDSTVVLDWIKGSPSKWKTFVANRVTEIQDGMTTTWGHVDGKSNPADCASRGIMPKDLLNHPLWWTGPSWLHSPGMPEKTSYTSNMALVMSEARNVTIATATVSNSTLPWYPCSSLRKLKSNIGWWHRYFHNRKFPTNKREGPLSRVELDKSFTYLLKLAQHDGFGHEIRCLEKGLSLPKSSKLKSLNIFLDANHVLRAGGRIRHASIPTGQRTPALLPRNHDLTYLIIRDEHEKTFHGGAQLILCNLQTRFWIFNGKDDIRHQIRRCPTCVRHRGEVIQPPMGDLPKSRVTPTRPFLTCGVDYAGPFQVKAIPGRSKVTFKAYLALFVCFSTHALHLEVVSSLTTDGFLAAFRRFTARRGRCKDIHSDCGTNFVGAARDLKELVLLVNSEDHNHTMTTRLAHDGINWHFNPAGAPHFGGLWEAGVKSVKFHLHRVIGTSRLNFEELTTMMAQIEACLNSRPLTPVSTDPDDLDALTPGHFLIGEPLLAIPEPDLTKEKVNRLTRWQLLQQMTQHFWSRWSREYLSRLQQRPKWLKGRVDVRVGDMVFIKEDNLAPLNWRLGRIKQLYPGADGVSRVATVRTADGEIKRPLVKLCLLPIDNATKQEISTS